MFHGNSVKRWLRIIKTIYQAPTAEQAEMCLTDFEEKWDNNTSLNRSILAQKLGSDNHVFCLSARDTQGNLYNERNRIIPEGVMADLQNYNWPGNIRELENVLERAVINHRVRSCALPMSSESRPRMELQ